MEEQKCRDCGKQIEIDKDQNITNGKLLKYYDETHGDVFVYKCSECYKKNPSLTNFRPCEVYSRIVGYLRPITQWNKGKTQEFKDRKNFK